MALQYTQTFTTSVGDQISVSAGDGDYMKLSIPAQGIALTAQDLSPIISLFQALSQAKNADLRLQALGQK